MYARVATFESDPSKVNEAIELVRSQVESFEDEEAMRRGDEALNAMNPGGTEQRTSVEFFEVPVHTVS